jgi:hypothetical protein
VLGLTQISNALRNLDEDEKSITIVKSLGGEQQSDTISESGLYALVLCSSKGSRRDAGVIDLFHRDTGERKRLFRAGAMVYTFPVAVAYMSPC